MTTLYLNFVHSFMEDTGVTDFETPQQYFHTSCSKKWNACVVCSSTVTAVFTEALRQRDTVARSKECQDIV